MTGRLRYAYGYNRFVAMYVASLIPHCQRGFAPDAKAIGVVNEHGKLIGGMVYHNWDPDAQIMEMSGAATDPRWLSRETLARLYRYPFLEVGCQMVAMRVPADYERLLRQLAEFGYVFIKVPRLFGRARDGVLCLLTYENWIENKFNRRYAHHLIPMEELEDRTQPLELIIPEAA